MNAVETTGLSKRYGRTWGLRDCSLAVPTGTVTALVGPNGAGKTTLLHLAAGLLRPTSGAVHVAGRPVTRRAHDLARVAFVAQDKPLWRDFTVADILHFGQRTNPGFDLAGARSRLDSYQIARDRRVGRLSGGQRTLVALTLALAKRADLLLLDEPLADLDPLARREVLGALLSAAAETGASVVLSSHILADLADTCDHLLLLNRGRLQLAGSLAELVEAHRVLTGPASMANDLARDRVVHLSTTPRQATALIQAGPGPAGTPPDLEDLVLAYLRNPQASWLPAPRSVPAGRSVPDKRSVPAGRSVPDGKEAR